MRAVPMHRRIAVRSGHKVGKSTLAASIALWWPSHKRRGRVIMTAPTARQVEMILWAEVRRLYHNAKVKLGGDMHQSPSSGLVWPDGREIKGFSTNEPERMAGISGEDVLFIVDEGSGVEEAIFEAIAGNMAGGASLLVLGNPTQTVGTFHNAFTFKREFWKTFHISSEETPNVSAGRTVVSGLATREWVEEKRKEWGEDSPLFQVRVKGNFPTQTENQIIGLGLIEQGTKDWREPERTDGPLEVGVDVARYGDDDTVIQARRGKYMYKPVVVHSMDTVEIADKVTEVVLELRLKSIVRLGSSSVTGEDVEETEHEKPRVKVDVIGVGAGVVDNLKRSQVLTCVPINVAESPTDDTYFRLRDQLWFAARDWLKDGGKFRSDDVLEQELLAPKYRVESRGQLRVESKDEIKEKIGRSPDRADAFSLAIYSPPPRRARVGASYL